MIEEFKFYHGVVLTGMVDNFKDEISFQRLVYENNAMYLVNDQIGLYIKHSAARLSPWRFSFQHENVLDIYALMLSQKNCFLALVCGRDCVAVLDQEEIHQLLNYDESKSQWISVATNHNRSLTVEGSQGRLKRKLLKTKPYERIYSLIEQG
jgi:hypothetical protein